MRYPAPLLAVLLVSCSLATTDVDAEKQALMAADRAFARETAARGVEGWLDFHLEDARNVPAAGVVVVGHQAIRERMAPFLADTTTAFTWEPQFAEVAHDGSLGYTYGDWTLTSRESGSLESRGRYLTVWRKRDGEWKVTTDIGNTDQ